MKKTKKQFNGQFSVITEIPEYAYCITADDAFLDGRGMINACEALNRAKEGDKILILINSPGGSVATLNLLLSAMKRSKAEITTRVTGYACSCGFMLWVSGDVIEAAPGSYVMAHGSSNSGMSGKTELLEEYTSATNALVAKLLQIGMDKNILTSDEFVSATKKKQDIYITYNELIKRGVKKAC